MALGCQPLPQPFAHPEDSINPAAVPISDIGGVTILPIWGLRDEKERGLSKAIADALLTQGIIAGPDSSNQRSKFLQGAVTQIAADGEGTRYTVVWDLFDGGGKLLASRETSFNLPDNYWLEREQSTLGGLVGRAAAKIANMVRSEDGRTAAEPVIALHVGKVEGVSNEAAAPLRQAMETALQRRKFRIANASDGAGLVISGAIELGPESAEPRPIRVTWRLRDKAGRELGKLTQRNAVQRQTLEKRWEFLATMIADSAAGGVGDLVVQLPPDLLKIHEKPPK